jgi:soluble lytic murein transglycosylase
MFEIGRTYEDDGQLESARTAYLRLLKRYPGSDAAAEARFRAPFMLYMRQHYDVAAGEFGAAKAHAAPGAARDAFAYWQARALERNGEEAEASRILRNVALSADSNYYAAIAGLRVHAVPDIFPAATAPELSAGSMPALSGPVGFHLSRVAALRDRELKELEPAELRAIGAEAGGNLALRNFVLAEFQAAGAWYDAIQLSTQMVKQGQLDPLIAERIRYPRGYWDLVSAAASRNRLNPYLIAGVIRQESLFNPDARSRSDARGLMQLLPSTAERYTALAGVMTSPLDLYDPDVSIRLGTVYLRGLLGMFRGDIFKAVAAYNAGEDAAAGWVAKYPEDDDQWVENISFRETRDYVKKVIGGMREYGLLYGARSARSTWIIEPRS